MPIRTNATLKPARGTCPKEKIENSRAKALPKPPVQSRSRGFAARRLTDSRSLWQSWPRDLSRGCPGIHPGAGRQKPQRIAIEA
jgi:hypothetical protein